MKNKQTKIANALELHQTDIARCVKCGSCSTVCPTYLHEHDESFSARGRMALIKAVLDGRLKVSRIYKDRLATCATCLACEAACPSNVPVTEILQAAKEQAVAESGHGNHQQSHSRRLETARPDARCRMACPGHAPLLKKSGGRGAGNRFKVPSIKTAEGGLRSKFRENRKKRDGCFFPGVRGRAHSD